MRWCGFKSSKYDLLTYLVSCLILLTYWQLPEASGYGSPISRHQTLGVRTVGPGESSIVF